jgi:Fur family transcriptional regulator, ferric uptake regulator
VHPRENVEMMTIARDASPLVCASIDDAVAVLRERGFRLTASRRLVLEALFAADGPISAEHITTQLRLDLTSVYRNLETLESQGLVRHVHLGHGPGLYALLGRGEREYLFCERCGAVKALTAQQLDPIRVQIRHRFGYEVRFTHFAIVGTCPTCAQPDPHDTAGRPAGHRKPDHAHSHGDHIHSHPHEHGPREHEHGH